MNRTVTQEYLNGILDARALWRSLTPEERITQAPAHLRNTEATMHTFSLGPVKDMLRGERDFWRGQISGSNR